MEIISYFVTVLSIIGTVANSFKKRWSFYIWLCSNMFWVVFNLNQGIISQALLYLFNSAMAAVGLWRWKCEEKEK